MKEKNAILKVESLKKYFQLRGGTCIKAVDGVSLDIGRGEALGLVGESGCGKTSLGRTIVGLYKPTEGQVIFEGKNIFHRRKMHPETRRSIQMIFQDPYASLNPRMTVANIVGEPIDIHGTAPGQNKADTIKEFLLRVGLKPVHAEQYPHELSGGQRQRVAIARALAANPKFIVWDEPVSSLDVSIRAQILKLLKEIQIEKKITYLLITHDLSVLRYICERVAVMYLGKIVEIIDSAVFFKNPAHPYTCALVSALPIPEPYYERQRKRDILRGEVTSTYTSSTGCKFQPRCPRASKYCNFSAPQLRAIAPGHFVACHNL